jgi:hypothetical protein
MVSMLRRPKPPRIHPLTFQRWTLAAVSSASVTEALEATQAAKVLTDSITSDPDIIGISGGDAALTDPQIDGLGATASDNLDVYNGGGA